MYALCIPRCEQARFCVEVFLCAIYKFSLIHSIIQVGHLELDAITGLLLFPRQSLPLLELISSYDIHGFRLPSLPLTIMSFDLFLVVAYVFYDVACLCFCFWSSASLYYC